MNVFMKETIQNKILENKFVLKLHYKIFMIHLHCIKIQMMNKKWKKDNKIIINL
jgi:hypothetical protein